MNELELAKIQDKMREFHKKTCGRLPNCIIVPAEYKFDNKDVFKEVSGVMVIYGSVIEPTVGLI